MGLGNPLVQQANLAGHQDVEAGAAEDVQEEHDAMEVPPPQVISADAAALLAGLQGQMALQQVAMDQARQDTQVFHATQAANMLEALAKTHSQGSKPPSSSLKKPKDWDGQDNKRPWAYYKREWQLFLVAAGVVEAYHGLHMATGMFGKAQAYLFTEVERMGLPFKELSLDILDKVMSSGSYGDLRSDHEITVELLTCQQKIGTPTAVHLRQMISLLELRQNKMDGSTSITVVLQ